jgi:hypothetical protein
MRHEPRPGVPLRDEVYRDDSPDRGKAEIIIGKQRNGPIGKVTLTFLGQHTRFENFFPEEYGEGYIVTDSRPRSLAAPWEAGRPGPRGGP